MPHACRESISGPDPRLSAGRRLRRALLVCLLTLVGAPGCSTFSLVRRPISPPSRVGGAVFVADGAGNFQAFSKTLRDVIYHAKQPTYVHTFEWSHGYGRILADQLGYDYAQNAGKALASQIEEFHAAYPTCRIFVAGHSAGSSVVLSALENLPPNVVERAFLVAPSVSADYDLAPALRHVGDAIHVYYSPADWWYLGFATQVVGTQDRSWLVPAAGRVGFRFAPVTGDESLRAKLRQHPWKARDGETGNLGGHFGAYQPEFLRRNLLPLTIPEATAVP
jgi:pimeloyl-ACP methyl ester carboxylesterase